MLEVNTIAPFALIKAALPWLRKTRGSVLNIGSVNAWSGEPNLMAYSVSKGALMTLTRNLGDTLMREDGVRVNQINPGWVLTEREAARKKDDGLAEDWYRNVPRVYAPAGRILWPAEIAAAVMYWLSDECGPISGQVVDLEQHPFIGRNPPEGRVHDSDFAATRRERAVVLHDVDAIEHPHPSSRIWSSDGIPDRWFRRGHRHFRKVRGSRRRRSHRHLQLRPLPHGRSRFAVGSHAVRRRQRHRRGDGTRGPAGRPQRFPCWPASAAPIRSG